jgi:3-dehydroquinate dehydratase/shikimate dehydrogenase
MPGRIATGGPLVCETVTADRMSDLRRARDRAVHADMVELRLDGVQDLDVAGALEGRRVPVIVTCRPAWEGGRFTASEAERLLALKQAIRLGAEFVDVEWRADRTSLPHGERTRVILSHHDFDGVPADLPARVRAMQGAGADVIKIAVTAHRVADCLTLREMLAGDGSHVAVAMGPRGQLTRMLPALFGSLWTYAGDAAPGQLASRTLIDTYRVRQTRATTDLYAVLGAPLGHSASPAMHNAALGDLGLDAVYVPLETSSADEVITLAEALRLRGASVTAPLKQALLERADRVSDVARQIGAVNTLRWTAHGLEGENFDAAGFMAPLDRRGLRPHGQRAVVLGAGGAARAAAWALRAHGARVEICARRAEQAVEIASALHVTTGAWPPAPGWDLLVNATPVGTWPRVDESPLPRAHLQGRTVYDLVYNPPETLLLRWARAAGVETIDGLEMLIAQARRQCYWWTGREASATAIERAALEFISASGVTA